MYSSGGTGLRFLLLFKVQGQPRCISGVSPFKLKVSLLKGDGIAPAFSLGLLLNDYKRDNNKKIFGLRPSEEREEVKRAVCILCV